MLQEKDENLGASNNVIGKDETISSQAPSKSIQTKKSFKKCLMSWV